MGPFTRRGRIFAGSLLCLALFSINLEANSIKLNENGNKIQIGGNTALGFTVSFSFSEFNTLDIKTRQGIFTRLIVPAYARHGSFGSPELPVCSKLIKIPVDADIQVRVLSYDVKEYSLKDLGIDYPVMPHQPPVPKTGEDVAFIYDKSSYKINAYNPVDIATVEHLGVMRGVEIGRLDIMPVQYNPVTGMVRVYENIEIKVTFENADLAETERNRQVYGNHYFSGIYRSLLNYKGTGEAGRENFTRYPVRYVIVSDRMFEAQLQPLIEWKKQKGFDVIEAYTDDPGVGTTTFQIKAYLQDLYDNATPEVPAPSFILFVGDIAQVPTWTGQAAGHVTDLYYCEYTGDYFPEVFYGRFSAQNISQLQPQIDKTLMYEQYTMPTTTYLDSVVMIAGMDGTFGPTHGNGQINYGTENYFNESNGLYSYTYLYPASGSNAAQIRQNISDGVTFANYTAHGSPNGWADPSFVLSHIPALQNDGKYGLLVGNCCSTSEYQVNECFGEGIVRAANKGALGYIGASNSTYWDEDYYFGVGVGAITGDPPSYEETTLGVYDRAFHSHGEAFAEWFTTMDQVIYAGNLAVTEGSPGSAEYYWEAYNLMGDPSLMIYFSEPPAMTVSYDPLIPMGSTTFDVEAVPYAYVAVTMDGVNLGTALADSNGMAVVNLVMAPAPGNADVVATAQNYQPFVGTVLIANPEGPYVMLNEWVVNDIDGNNNGIVDFGESILLDVELKNWGSGDAQNVNATLYSTDDYVTVSDNYHDYGLIMSADSVMQTGAFQFVVDEFVPDQHPVIFDLSIEDGAREIWVSSFSVMLNAPAMEIGSLIVVDTNGGNGNYRLDPGETVELVLDCHNNGHCDALNCLTTIQSNSPYIIIDDTPCSFDTLLCGGMKQAVFTATIAEDVEAGTIIDLSYELTSGLYSSSCLYNIPIGLIIEDFETGDFQSFNWVMSGTQPWTMTTENVFEGIYSARSGIIGNEQTSVISIDVNVSIDDSLSFYRKVSCEDDPGNDIFDWLGFFIDDIEMERWDGEVAWSRVVYPVTAGPHTFKWVYNKDFSVAGGADAAWIDNITFPAIAPLVTVEDNTIKRNSDFYILPNPAKEQTGLYVGLNSASLVSITVYDLSGNVTGAPLMQQFLPAGLNKVVLETSDLKAGMYFCVMTADNQQVTKKLLITK